MTKALTTKPSDRLKFILNMDSVKEQFQNALGKQANLFTASLLDVYNDGLDVCEPKEVVQEALKAAVLKLPISKGLGFAYIIPYNKKYKEGNEWKSRKAPQFQLGYKGLIQLAMRSGQVRILNAGPIYEGEFQGQNRLSGEVDLTGQRISKKEVGYFAYMELINGFQKCVYWSKEDVIEHAEKHSKSYGNKKSTWTTDFTEMATKTPLKALLSKYAPMSIDFVLAMAQDDALMGQPEIKDITPPAPNKKQKPAQLKTEQKQDIPPDSDAQFFEQQAGELEGDPGF